MGMLGGIVKPMANVAQNSAKAGKLKSIKLKMKFDAKAGGKSQQKSDPKSDAS
jgi:hypothetical protein